VFVPLPSASTNEQVHNARVCERNNAAIVLADADLGTSLFSTITDVMNNSDKRASMAAAMLQLGKPNAAHDAASLILQVSGWKGQP
jgi:UDP-N-acetylglucosamine--N-acetylmuramyl-(pentapeptide) pyrophosphoryl-undecaprenol N-acetylglucosamine transferase